MPETTTQGFLEVEQIKDGTVILKSKALRGIIMVSSLNFSLKSEEEQSAIIYQFQNFLNSLDFSIEIIVQSRRLNITDYLEKLKELELRQENELLRYQTADYRNFIVELISGSRILSKSFFVIVPFALIEIPGISAEKKDIKKENKQKQIIPLTEAEFQRAKSQLWQRMEFVSLGIRRCGLQSVPLHTSELIEFFWQLHHPEESEIGHYPEIPPEFLS